MQWTVRKRFNNGLQFDLNYTLSKSIDLASHHRGRHIQRVRHQHLEPQPDAGRFGLRYPSVGERQLRLPPSVRPRPEVCTSVNKIVDAFIGGWEVSGLYRQTSGLPFTIINGQRWPTNWEVDAHATPNGQPIPPVVSTGNATGMRAAGRICGRIRPRHSPAINETHGRPVRTSRRTSAETDCSTSIAESTRTSRCPIRSITSSSSDGRLTTLRIRCGSIRLRPSNSILISSSFGKAIQPARHAAADAVRAQVHLVVCLYTGKDSQARGGLRALPFFRLRVSFAGHRPFTTLPLATADFAP